MTIKDKLFIFGGPGSFRKRLKIVLLAPIFIVIGVNLRFVFIPPFENTEVLNSVVHLVFVFGAMGIGFGLLELID
jgi:polyferredoxin